MTTYMSTTVPLFFFTTRAGQCNKMTFSYEIGRDLSSWRE